MAYLKVRTRVKYWNCWIRQREKKKTNPKSSKCNMLFFRFSLFGLPFVRNESVCLICAYLVFFILCTLFWQTHIHTQTPNKRRTITFHCNMLSNLVCFTIRIYCCMPFTLAFPIIHTKRCIFIFVVVSPSFADCPCS